MTTAVIVAAGRGDRLPGEVPKQFRDLCGLPILEWSVRAFEAHPEVDQVVVVLPPELAEPPPEWLADRAIVVAGGATRAASVVRGVATSGRETSVFLIHDGVRPFVSSATISKVLDSARSGPTVPVLPVTDTIKCVDRDGWVERTPARDALRAAQTPQGFPAELLRELHRRTDVPEDVTDDSVGCERSGIPVRTVMGDARNLKITSEADLDYARWLVEGGMIERPSLS
ncbi:MAG: 2-C-methyl-D-erythritol 4-phosphate cytidylyltransferase [Gemmatimonadota bacterium]